MPNCSSKISNVSIHENAFLIPVFTFAPICMGAHKGEITGDKSPYTIVVERYGLGWGHLVWLEQFAF